MQIHNYKILRLIVGGFILIPLIFRFTPYLFPITKGDITGEQFHSVKFFDRHGNLLQEVLSQNQSKAIYVDFESISPYFIDAMIATEDKNFYRHHGIDYEAVCRAIIQNIKSKRVVSGASTITLQLARLLHPGKRTLIKKIKEAFYAYRLEAGLEKKNILEAYMNRLPMGGNLYGLESAAKTYFGISSADLTLAQATFLASIPNSPNQLNPYHNLREIKKRQRIVLERMTEQKMISRDRIQRVLKEEIQLKPQCASFLAPHFVFHLMDKIPDEAQTVKTTINIELQKMVSEQIKNILDKLKPYHVTNGSAILLDNHTGDVLAYTGSADYFNTEIEGQNDGIRALRQPGSTLKPFLYILAMEEGFNPATLISDIPTHYRMPEGIYAPQNYSETYHGPVRLREALANSLNIPAVRTLAKIGIDPFLSRLREYEFESLDKEPDYYGIGIVLGGGEVTLSELTRAYMCLARMGNFLPTKEIIELNDKPYKQPIEMKTISTPQLNYLISDILSDPFARTTEFGFHSVLNLPFPCSVKTGTSFHFCDNWTIGFTEDYTLGVWVGNFDHSPMLKVSGISGAGPIFWIIMSELYQNKPYPEKFQMPEGLIRVKICPLSGKKPGPYCPSYIEEIIPEKDFASYQMSSCDLHAKKNKKMVKTFPNRFQTWSKAFGFETQNVSDSLKQTIRIINPQNGAIYQRLPNLSPEFQSIRCELVTPEKESKINWYLNNEYIQTTSDKHCFLRQVQSGQYILKAISEKDNQVADSVEFRVQ